MSLAFTSENDDDDDDDDDVDEVSRQAGVSVKVRGSANSIKN